VNFSQRRADPGQNLVGITLVIVLHVVVIHTMAAGATRKVADGFTSCGARIQGCPD
jgi:hypothetical protein